MFPAAALGALCLLVAACGPAGGAPDARLIPRPLSSGGGFGSLALGPDITIVPDSAFLGEAAYLRDGLVRLGYAKAGVQSAGLAKPPAGSLVIRLSGDDPGVAAPGRDLDARGDEAYRLRLPAALPGLGRDGVLIEAKGSAGAFYGAVSLLQMAEGLSARGAPAALPACDIADCPRFGWRGSMLDCSRHFIPVDYIKRHLELMARFKLNVFHWHLSDDQGWRLWLPKRDKLASVGAWRKRAEPEGPDGQYGGYYDREDIVDVVAYAQARHITIVPEIDLPGHASAAIASYPEIACGGKGAPRPKQALSEWGIFGNNLCPGKEASFAFVDEVVAELAELFPGPYIHIGGDEVDDISAWENCPDCQRRLRSLGATDARQLERYFVNRAEQIVRDHGRTPMAWDDVVHSVSQTSTVLQFWTNQTNLQEGREIGFRFVLSPGAYAYLDMNYAPPEVRRWAGYISIEKSYALDPGLWSLADDEVRGLEAPLWTEHCADPAAWDRQLWPRLCAIAEAAWSPRDKRDWPDFARRLQAMAPLLDRWGVAFYRSPELPWR